MSLFYRFIRALAIVYVHIVYNCKVINKENLLSNGGIVLCSNHQSFNDVLLLASFCNRPLRFMGKEELFKNKIIAYLFKKLGAFPVSRGKGDSNAIDMAKSIVQNKEVFMIFPEGTRSKDGKMLRAKSGAAVVASSCDAPIIPVAIKYSSNCHFFCKASLIFGKPIELKMQEQSRGEIRRISTAIIENIKELYEKI